jgi:hypothetical protein
LPSTYFRFEPRSRSTPARSPALERLLEFSEDPAPVVDWRKEAQLLLRGPDAQASEAAPVALLAQTGTADCGIEARHAFLASPVHARASLTSVRLPHGGVLSLTPGESRDLAADFNDRLAHGRLRMLASPGGQLFCVCDTALQVETCEPEMLQGYDLREFQPRGPDAALLKKACSEIEMWLYGHPANLRRRASGELEITGFWLWGGGPVIRRMPPRHFEFVGDDVMFSAWSERAPASGPGLGTIIRCREAPGDPAFERFARAPLEQAARSLRSGSAGALHLSCGSRSFTVRRMRRWFFRRTRPWWEHFND